MININFNFKYYLYVVCNMQIRFQFIRQLLFINFMEYFKYAQNKLIINLDSEQIHI